MRVDELLWRAAELWPGLVPTRDEVAAEAERMQADKDGREIQQGLFVSQMLCDPDIGTHLITSMLAPTKEATSRVDELVERAASIWAPRAWPSKARSATSTSNTRAI